MRSKFEPKKVRKTFKEPLLEIRRAIIKINDTNVPTGVCRDAKSNDPEFCPVGLDTILAIWALATFSV